VITHPTQSNASGYKTGEGIEPDLLAQFSLLEEVLSAAGMSSGQNRRASVRARP